MIWWVGAIFSPPLKRCEVLVTKFVTSKIIRSLFSLIYAQFTSGQFDHLISITVGKGQARKSAPPQMAYVIFSLSLPHFAPSAFSGWLTPARVTAVFDNLTHCHKSRAAGFAATFAVPAFFLRSPVKSRAAVRTAKQGVCSPELKLFSAAFANQLERLSKGVFAGLHHLVAFPALDTVPEELFLPPNFLWSELRHRRVKPADILQINFHFLRPVALGTVRGVDNAPRCKGFIEFLNYAVQFCMPLTFPVQPSRVALMVSSTSVRRALVKMWRLLQAT